MGSVTWPVENPRLRRKYGTITLKNGLYGGQKLNFIEYSRIHVGSNPPSSDEVIISQAVPRPARTTVSKGGGPTALSFEEAEHLLNADEGTMARVPARPNQLGQSISTTNDIFFERRMVRRSSMADRWNTSGGVKGSTVWPSTGPWPARVRRRYGRVTARPLVEGGLSVRFVVYSQIRSEPSVRARPGRLSALAFLSVFL